MCLTCLSLSVCLTCLCLYLCVSPVCLNLFVSPVSLPVCLTCVSPVSLSPVCLQQVLLVFLRQVVSHQDQNRMSLWNVSMVMAPNLFTCHRRGNKRFLSKQQEEMEEAVGGAHLVRLMVAHLDVLWTVSQKPPQSVSDITSCCL